MTQSVLATVNTDTRAVPRQKMKEVIEATQVLVDSPDAGVCVCACAYVHVCVCACMCVKERERRERENERARARASARGYDEDAEIFD